MKKTIIYIISFFLFTAPFTCQAIKEQTFVIDNAKIIKADTTDYINVYSKYLKDNLDIEYYVITETKINDEMTIEEYTDYIYEAGDISDKSLLIVISKENRKIRIKVGTELSKIIYDETINEYLNNYFVPYLKTDEWDTGIKNGYSAFFKLLCNYYEIDSEVVEVYDGNSFLNKNKTYIIIAIIWITSLFSYIYNNYLKRLNKGHIHLKDKIIISICLLINIGLLIFSYYIQPLSLLVILASELILTLSNLSSSKKKPKKIKKSRKKYENIKKKS
ncbi:MAG: TPM domain-containing protein [Bacilli bacterium]|nr:TPM domain-containing protein [Bacilli bacterium]